MSRGTLRIYLGAAPGVGKTFAMLDEGRRRREPRHRRGRRLRRDPRPAQHHGRSTTSRSFPAGASTTGTRPSRRWTSTPSSPARPRVALVDELAHTNVPGSRNPKRWQDVEELLLAGINVISTVNIQHLESLNDVVERITGIVQRETIPDEIVRRRRPDRARRHDPRGAAAAHGPRQHLRPREGRRRPGQLLPGREPGCAPGAGVAVGRRPGRRRPGGVPKTPRHHGAMGDPRACRRRPHRRARHRGADPPGRPHRPAGPRRTRSACTSAATKGWPRRRPGCLPSTTGF